MYWINYLYKIFHTLYKYIHFIYIFWILLIWIYYLFIDLLKFKYYIHSFIFVFQKLVWWSYTLYSYTILHCSCFGMVTLLPEHCVLCQATLDARPPPSLSLSFSRTAAAALASQTNIACNLQAKSALTVMRTHNAFSLSLSGSLATSA